MKRSCLVPGLILLLVAAAAGWWFRAGGEQWLATLGVPVTVTGRRGPDAARYAELKAGLDSRRIALAAKYDSCRSRAERTAVIDEASKLLADELPRLMECWLGTPWDFNGTAEGPGRQPVACGYFVATVLRDAGFKVNRYQLAREPSENILRTFVPAGDTTRRVGVSYENFAGELRGMEPGVRIVGLDTHVGFLVVRPDGFRFVHSSGSRPWCVVDESEQDAGVLARSNYRVHGCLTQNRDLIARWLRGEKIAVYGKN